MTDEGRRRLHELAVQSRWAATLAQHGREAQAMTVYRRTPAGYERILGHDDDSTRNTRNRLTLLAIGIGDPEAESLQRAVLDDWERNKGADHPGALANRANLASLLAKTGRLDEAEELYRRSVDDHVRVFAADDRRTRIARDGLDGVRRRRHRP